MDNLLELTGDVEEVKNTIELMYPALKEIIPKKQLDDAISQIASTSGEIKVVFTKTSVVMKNYNNNGVLHNRHLP